MFIPVAETVDAGACRTGRGDMNVSCTTSEVV
jgi:hypothetical protein